MNDIELKKGSDVGEMGEETVQPVSSKRKWLLLVIYCVAQVCLEHSFIPKRQKLMTVTRLIDQYLDLASRAAVVIFVDSIAEDLNISRGTNTWILVSSLYSPRYMP
jgi:hypothetical protein